MRLHQSQRDRVQRLQRRHRQGQHAHTQLHSLEQERRHRDRNRQCRLRAHAPQRHQEQPARSDRKRLHEKKTFQQAHERLFAQIIRGWVFEMKYKLYLKF